MTTETLQLIKNAQEAISLGDRLTARKILVGILNQDSHNEDAWLLLSYAVDDTKHKIDSLNRVLLINPNNVIAKTRLDDLLNIEKSNATAATVISINYPREKQVNPNSLTHNPPGESKDIPKLTQAVNQKPQINKVKRRTTRKEWILILSALGLFICYSTMIRINSGNSVDNTEVDVICHNFIRQVLLAPSSAKFTPGTVYTFKDQENKYRATGYVDAQNGFGALIRNYYSCDLQYKGGEWSDIRNWTLLDFNLE
jgi:hypothetical protein